MVSGGWIMQADRTRWQLKAASELAAILKAHPDIPVIAWTVTVSGGALSGQVLAPAGGRRGLFAEWRQALGLDEVTENRVRNRDACLPACSRCPRRRRGQRHRDRLRRRGGQLVSGPEAAEGGQHQSAAGLLGKLMAAVRPEFRADELVFDQEGPVFGGKLCLVTGCGRAARGQGLCHGHQQRWAAAAGQTWPGSPRPPIPAGGRMPR